LSGIVFIFRSLLSLSGLFGLSGLSGLSDYQCAMGSFFHSQSPGMVDQPPEEDWIPASAGMTDYVLSWAG